MKSIGTKVKLMLTCSAVAGLMVVRKNAQADFKSDVERSMSLSLQNFAENLIEPGCIASAKALTSADLQKVIDQERDLLGKVKVKKLDSHSAGDICTGVFEIQPDPSVATKEFPFPKKQEISDSAHLAVTGDNDDLSLPGMNSLKGSSEKNLDKFQPKGKIGKISMTISSSALVKLMQSIENVLASARAVPTFKDGKAIGLKFIAISPNGLWALMGMKKDDILLAVNRDRISDPASLFQTLASLKELKWQYSVVERKGEQVEILYRYKK